MKTFLIWWRIRKLRRAQERHAYWKARREAVSQINKVGSSIWSREEYVDAAAEEAKYMERVEHLFREP